MVKRMEHMVIVIVMVMDKAGNGHVFTVLHISLERLCCVCFAKISIGAEHVLKHSRTSQGCHLFDVLKFLFDI